MSNPVTVGSPRKSAAIIPSVNETLTGALPIGSRKKCLMISPCWFAARLHNVAGRRILGLSTPSLWLKASNAAPPFSTFAGAIRARLGLAFAASLRLLFARLLAGDARAFGVHALDGAAFVVPPLGGTLAWVVGAFWVLVGHFPISRHRAYLCIRFQKRCGDERKIANRLHTPEHHADVEGLRRLPHRSRGRWRITIPEPSIVRHNRLAEKRIYRDCQIGEFVGSDDMTLSSRPIASISASLHSYQSRSKFAAWFHGTWHRNKIR